MRDFPLRAWLYTAAVAGATAVGVLLVLSGRPLDAGAIVAFGLLFLLAEIAPVSLAHVSYSVGFVVALAAVISLGPGAAAVAASFAAFDIGLRRRPDWMGRLVFNGAQFSLSTLATGVVYRALGGPIGEIGAVHFPGALIPIAAATVAFFVVNTLLVANMVALVRRVAWAEVWASDYRVSAISYLGFAALGVMMAALYLEVNFGALLFLLIPLFVARGAFQASNKLQTAFDSTLRSLITAIEAKDLYTRGHAERVSRLAAMIARQYGLPAAKVRRVRYAALMHDVGKLTVDTRILQKPGKLTPEEFEHMKIHPIRGSEIVAEIDLLADMVDGVRHHHERMDGRGYPDGLAGEGLSLAARMIMVADAFDSMTSTRSYRRAMPMEAAFAELRRCQGTQFAEEMIDALVAAIERWGWEPAPEAYEGESTPRPAVNPHAALG